MPRAAGREPTVGADRHGGSHGRRQDDGPSCHRPPRRGGFAMLRFRGRSQTGQPARSAEAPGPLRGSCWNVGRLVLRWPGPKARCDMEQVAVEYHDTVSQWGRARRPGATAPLEGIEKRRISATFRHPPRDVSGNRPFQRASPHHHARFASPVNTFRVSPPPLAASAPPVGTAPARNALRIQAPRGRRPASRRPARKARAPAGPAAPCPVRR